MVEFSQSGLTENLCCDALKTMTIVDSRASRRKASSSGQSTAEGANACVWLLKFEDLEPYYEEVEEAPEIAGPTFIPGVAGEKDIAT
jgi:hypothetical protein